MTKEITIRGGKNSPTQKAEQLISQAISKNVPVEVVERILAMRKELKAEFAKEEYDKAMAKFQQDCPIIKKTKEVRTKSGAVAYRFAPIEDIVKQTKDSINKNGFSYSIQSQTSKDERGGALGVKGTCIVKHIAGHSEPYDVEVPLVNKTDVMSMAQVVAATLTFAKRYAFCNAFGILTSDDDTDGKIPTNKASQPVNVTGQKEEKAKITFMPQLKDKLYKMGAKNEKEALKILEERTGLLWKDFNYKTEKATQLALAKLLNSK